MNIKGILVPKKSYGAKCDIRENLNGAYVHLIPDVYHLDNFF